MVRRSAAGAVQLYSLKAFNLNTYTYNTTNDIIINSKIGNSQLEINWEFLIGNSQLGEDALGEGRRRAEGAPARPCLRAGAEREQARRYSFFGVVL